VSAVGSAFMHTVPRWLFRKLFKNKV
jgi:hypothetical protein